MENGSYYKYICAPTALMKIQYLCNAEDFLCTQDDQVVIIDMSEAFEADSLANSHPIRIPIERPEDINQIFDSITYEKVLTEHVDISG